MKNIRLWLLGTLAVLAVVGGSLVGCGNDTPGPTGLEPVGALSSPKSVVPPSTNYFEDVWETVYNTQFNAASSLAFVGTEVQNPGSYQGVNTSSEAFTLTVSEVTYYDQSALVALDPTLAPTVQALNLTASIVVGTYAGPKGSRQVNGCIRSLDILGVRYHYYIPVADTPSIPTSFTMNPPAGKTGPRWDPAKSLVPEFFKDQECEDNCNSTSPQPSKPPINCPDDKKLDQTCKAGCDAAWEQAINGPTGAMPTGCKTKCDAKDDYDTHMALCNGGGVIAWGGTFAGIIQVTSPIGLAATVITDLAEAAAYQVCVNAAENNFNTEVDRADREYNDAVEAAENAYKACAANCCREITEEEILNIISN